MAALLCAGAMHDALFGRQLATTRQLHQRAAALADFGLHHAMALIAGSGVAGSLGYAVQPYPPSTDSVTIGVRHLGNVPLPKGFSAGHFDVHRFEIESTGHAARGIAMTQVQGVTRTMPIAVAGAGP